MAFSKLSEGSIQEMLTKNESGSSVIQVLGLTCVHMHNTNRATRANRKNVGWYLNISDGKEAHFAWLSPDHHHLITSGKLIKYSIIKVIACTISPITVFLINEGKLNVHVQLAIKNLAILHSGQDVLQKIGNPISITELRPRIGGTTSALTLPENILKSSNQVSSTPTGKIVLKRTQSLQSPDTTGKTPPAQQGTVAKNPRTEEVEDVAPTTPLNNPTQPPTSVAVQTSRVVAICSKDYPLIHLTPEQIDEMTVAILDKIVQNKDGQVKPKFTNSLLKTGYLSLTCKDDLTTDWLVKIIPTIVPWEGAKLHALDEEALPYPRCAIAFIPNGAKLDTNRILALLEGQNDHYNFGAWALLNRMSIGINTTVFFAIDKISADLLQENDHELNFGFGQIPVSFKD